MDFAPRPSSLSSDPRADASYDAIVLGSGLEGSVIAAALAEAGWSVLILEPRHTASPATGSRIGGLAGELLERWGLQAELADRRFPASLGFEVIGREVGDRFEVPKQGPGWYVRTADLEQLLLQHAIDQGATHRRGHAVRVMTEGSRVVGLVWEPASMSRAEPRATRCTTFVDASGREAFLSRQAIAGPRTFEPAAPGVQASAAFHLAGGLEAAGAERARIFYDTLGHWASWTPLSPDLVSVTVTVSQATYQRHAKTPAQLLEWGGEQLHPELRELLVDAARAGAVDLDRVAAYRIDPAVGEGWLCLGAAHRQVDPLFAFGPSLALAEAEAAARALLAAPSKTATPRVLQSLVALGARAHDTASDLTHYFWRFPGFFRQLVEGRLGTDFLALLEGSALASPGGEAMRVVRGRLTAAPLEDRDDLRIEEIVHRVRDRYTGVPAVQAAFLELGESGARLSLVVDESEAGEALLHDFEESLYQEFGREFLLVIRWSDGSSGALTAPDFQGARAIFDRRAS